MNNVNKSEITITGIKTAYYTVEGEGATPVLFLHGGGVDSAILSWEEVMEVWNGRQRLIAPNLPGASDAEKPDAVYSVDFYVDFVHQFIRQLGLTKVVLCGLSLGGSVSLKLALTYPHLVEKIVLVAPWGIVKSIPYQRFMAYMVRSWWYPKLTFFYKSKWLTRWALGQTLFGDKRKLTPELVETVSRFSTEKDGIKAFQSFQQCEIVPKQNTVTSYFMPFLHQITMPVLFVMGEKDPGVPLRYAEEACQAMPNARLVVFENHKHWLQKESPERFASVVAEFVGS